MAPALCPPLIHLLTWYWFWNLEAACCSMHLPSAVPVAAAPEAEELDTLPCLCSQGVGRDYQASLIVF